MLLARRTLIGSIAALAVAGAALAGCAASGGAPSSSSRQASQTPQSSATRSTSLPVASSAQERPAADQTAPEGVGMIGPVIVIAGQAAASVEVGRVVVINVDDPTQARIATDRPDLLEFTQGRFDGSAWFNPGALALAPGEAILSVTDGEHTREIAITILPAAR